MSNYTFDSDSLKYLLDKLKELFSLKSEADLKVDKVDGKDLVTNDYTDEYAQLNNKIINDITISDKTDTEVTLTFSRKNGDSSSIKIPYDKYKKSALFVDTPEKFLCLANEENKINYRYISSLKDGNHNLVVEKIKSTGVSTDYQESYTYDKIPDYYLYVPEEDDVALKMYFIDPENTMTGVACLEPEAAYLIAEYILNEINDNAYPDCNDGSFTNFTTNDTQNDDNTFTRTVFAGKEGPTKIDFRNTTGLTKINKIGPSVTNMTNAFSGCSNLTGSPVCGDKVTDMAGAYQSCTNLKGSPVCGPKVTNMHQTYCDCNNLTGSPVCGDNVTNMSGTYHYCFNLTGSPVCGNSVTNMNSAYRYCQNLTGQPVCGNNVTDMTCAYQKCTNLTGAPVCGNNVFDMTNTYAKCHNLAGQPVCGDNVTNMSNTYIDCWNLTGNPACGNNVTNMSCTYWECSNLTGNPVCGDKVIDMGGAYKYCYNITGSPVCGPKVTTMTETYYECTNLTGNPVCGDNVIAMDWTYYNCYNLTGVPVCGYNVNSMFQTYYNCRNLSSNAYFYSNKITYAVECFGERNTDKRLNLYVPENSTTLTTCLCDSSSSSLTGTDITWTDSVATNGYYFNTTSNIYIYPVANVEQTYKDNVSIASYTASTSGVRPVITSDYEYEVQEVRNTVNTNLYDVTVMSEGIPSHMSLSNNPNLVSVNRFKTVNMYNSFYNSRNLTGSPICGNNVINMANAYYNCHNLTGSPVCGSSVIDMYYAYYRCYNITGSPVCGNNVTDMSYAYYDCRNLTGAPACGNNVTDMCAAYYGCSNLTGPPVCGPNVTDMGQAYEYCYNLTGNPVCGNKVSIMDFAYQDCRNLTGAPVCGPNVTYMDKAYDGCTNLYGNMFVYSNNVSRADKCFAGRNTSNQLNIFVNFNTKSYTCFTTNKITETSLTWTNAGNGKIYCWNDTANIVIFNMQTTNMANAFGFDSSVRMAACGPKVTDMSEAYQYCSNLKGSPACGPNVTNMYYAYDNCQNLTGSPVCGDSVTDMGFAFYNCVSLTGNPVCGNNVTDMYCTYRNCVSLTGSPVCGPNVTNMRYAYNNCSNLTGSPVCGNNVSNFGFAYRNCSNLTGSPACGSNVTNMYCAYENCPNLYGDMFVYSDKISNATDCFVGRNTSKILNLYVPASSTTLATCLNTSDSTSLTGTNITWTNDTANNRYYNTAQNIYIYPVVNVADGPNEYMKTVLMYSAKNSNARPTIEGLSDFNIKASAVKQSTVTTTPIQLIVTKEQHNTGTMPEYSTIVDSLPEAVNEVNTNEVNIISTEESSVSPRVGVGGIYTIILQSMDRNRIKDYKLYVDGVYYSSWTDDDTTFQFDFTGDYLWFRAIISLYDPDQVTFDYTYDQMSYTTYELPGDFYLVDCGENSECDLTIIKKNENETINGFKFDDPEVKSVITDIKFISDEVTNMSKTFYGCPVLSGSPICGNSVIDMSSAYYQCTSLTGSPVCGDNVTNMYGTYYRCENLTGNVACGPNVVNISNAYYYCYNLTGSPVCGDNVTDMSYTYYGCSNLTGDPVCENNVTNMSYTYRDCYSLTGSPICGPNVTDMSGAYHSCRNLSSNGYFYSNKIVNVCNCFYGRNTSKRLNLYVPANSTTLNTCLGTTYKTSLTGGSITWTDSVATNGCYYNTTRNIYIYPVDNVAQIYEVNELNN